MTLILGEMLYKAYFVYLESFGKKSGDSWYARM